MRRTGTRDVRDQLAYVRENVQVVSMRAREYASCSHASMRTFELFPCVCKNIQFVSMGAQEHASCFYVCMRTCKLFPCVHENKQVVSMCAWENASCFHACLRTRNLFPCVDENMRVVSMRARFETRMWVLICVLLLICDHIFKFFNMYYGDSVGNKSLDFYRLSSVSNIILINCM